MSLQHRITKPYVVFMQFYSHINPTQIADVEFTGSNHELEI